MNFHFSDFILNGIDSIDIRCVSSALGIHRVPYEVFKNIQAYSGHQEKNVRLIHGMSENELIRKILRFHFWGGWRGRINYYNLCNTHWFVNFPLFPFVIGVLLPRIISYESVDVVNNIIIYPVS